MSVDSILHRQANLNNWDEHAQLAACLEYIERQKDDACFDDFLRDRAPGADRIGMGPVREVIEHKQYSVEGTHTFCGPQVIEGIFKRWDTKLSAWQIEIRVKGLPSLFVGVAAQPSREIQVYVERETTYLATKIERDVLAVKSTDAMRTK